MRTAARRIYAPAACLIATMAIGVSSASAEYAGHVLTNSFEPAGAEALSAPQDIAVDDSSGPSHGDLYVSDRNHHRVEKFSPSGTFLLMFGDEVDETTGGDVCPVNPGDVCKEGNPGGGAQQLGYPTYVAVDSSSGPSAGDVYVVEWNGRTIRKYNENGVLQTGWANGGVLTGAGSANGGPFERAPAGITVDSAGNLDVLSTPNEPVGGKVIRFEQDGTPIAGPIGSCNEDTTFSGLGISPDDTMFYKLNTYRQITRFTGNFSECATFSSNGGFEAKSSLAVDSTTGTVFGLTNETFNGRPGEVDEYLLDGTGKFPLNSAGEPCPESEMASSEPYLHGCPPTHRFGREQVRGAVAIAVDSSDNTVYAAGTKIYVFKPLNVPKASTGPTSSVAESTAKVTGHVDPDGAGTITECYFEFGPTTAYGNEVPCNPEAPLNSPTDVEAEFTKLSSGHLYHYRIVAGNELGRVVGADHSLTTTAPPSINSASASDLTATTAILHATIVPNSIATTYRFEYGTSNAYGTDVPIPDEAIGAGSAPVEVSQAITGLIHATYYFRVVAENALGTTVSEGQTFNFFPQDCPNRTVRQATGSDYLPDCRAYELVSPANAGDVIFTPESEVPVSTYATDPARLSFMGSYGVVTGTEPPNGGGDLYTATRTATGWHTAFIGRDGKEVQDNCYENGNLLLSVFLTFRCEYVAFQGVQQPPENIPSIVDANGKSLGRWPATWSLIEGANQSIGAFQPSPDFSHLAFSSNNRVFAPNGLDHAPGSAYDYDVATGTTKIISYQANGSPIEQEPGDVSNQEEFIMFPGVFPREGAIGKPRSNNIHPSVSTDGSHILMSTASAPTETFGSEEPVRLYMRVDDAVTYEVSDGKYVRYAGMSEDGTKVFFTSNEQLTSEDTDASTDLYMWSQESDSIKLISIGEDGTGNSDSCTPSAGWTTKCSVKLPESEKPWVDNFISPKNGDIYFYSPERLVGVDAAEGEQNLYRWHEGELSYVAAANLSRIQTTPEDSRMAFITRSRVTSYDNKGFQEMYTYTPATNIIRCVSCPTEGKELTGNVEGSLNGRYITDDGRTFFYTPDGLVSDDTNHVRDVYEFVNGRPQLITPGTANQDSTTTFGGGSRKAGLIGVSGDGVNVYFATFDTLVPEDQNGQFIKFYDARTGGGFPVEAPLQPCQAADECHGQGTEPPAIPTPSSINELGSTGNVHREAKKSKAKKQSRKSRHRRRKNRHKRHHASHSRRHVRHSRGTSR